MWSPRVSLHFQFCIPDKCSIKKISWSAFKPRVTRITNHCSDTVWYTDLMISCSRDPISPFPLIKKARMLQLYIYVYTWCIHYMSLGPHVFISGPYPYDTLDPWMSFLSSFSFPLCKSWRFLITQLNLIHAKVMQWHLGSKTRHVSHTFTDEWKTDDVPHARKNSFLRFEACSSSCKQFRSLECNGSYTPSRLPAAGCRQASGAECHLCIFLSLVISSGEWACWISAERLFWKISVGEQIVSRVLQRFFTLVGSRIFAIKQTSRLERMMYVLRRS